MFSRVQHIILMQNSLLIIFIVIYHNYIQYNANYIYIYPYYQKRKQRVKGVRLVLSMYTHNHFICIRSLK